MKSLRVLIVDDESLARSRLRTLLDDCHAPGATVVGEAGNAVQAMIALQRESIDLVLLDIRMPGVDGTSLARTMAELPAPPAVVFVTAHAEHAVQAFELAATDYLTKPVRLERLQQALRKAVRVPQGQVASSPELPQEVLLIQDRGRTERVPLRDVIYLKAELKYITVRTAVRSYIFDGSLNELEEKYARHFLRVHRNALISRRAVRALEKYFDPEEGEGWAVRLNGIDELLAVSRRQLAAVRAEINAA